MWIKGSSARVVVATPAGGEPHMNFSSPLAT